MKNIIPNNLKISLIIPVYNDPGNLQKCLTSVAQTADSNYECIVVDDASTDETVSVAKKFNVQVVELKQNRGPSFARNAGAKTASGNILFFIDADIRIYPNTISKIVESFTMNPEVDAFIGSYDDNPGHPSFISQYKNMFHHYVHQTSNEIASTFWAACGAIRREVFLQVGGFNECYLKPAIEDIELGYCLTAKKHTIILKKDLLVQHLKKWTLWRLFKTDVFQRGIPWTELMLRERIFQDDLNLRSTQRLSVVLVYLSLTALLLLAESMLYLPLLLLSLGTVIILNWQFYRFFAQKQNILFAVKVFPLHIFYFFYCGLGLFLGLVYFFCRRLQLTQQKKDTFLSHIQG